MKILYISALLIFCVLLYAFFRRAAKGPKKVIDRLERPIEDLLKRGFDGGTLIIDHVSSDKFVQFHKYIHKKGIYGIQMDFPDAEWSNKYLAELKAYCDEYQLKIRENPVVPGKGLSFVEIDFEKDTKRAHALVKHVFLEIFGLADTEKYYVLLENAAGDDVLVDSK